MTTSVTDEAHGEGGSQSAATRVGAPAAEPLTALRTGTQVFMGIELACASGALVPRPETEILGYAAVGILREMQAAKPGVSLRVIDMCCGSGNLACAVASLVPSLRVWASDLTPETTSLARANVERLKLSVVVKQGDLFEPFAEGSDEPLLGTIDVIVCNPPYISTGRLAKDRAELLLHEPREAFDGGPYGLSIHQRVIKEAPTYLRPGGFILVELGVGQAKQVRRLFERSEAYEDIQERTDAAGEPRVLLARTNGEIPK